MALPMDTLAIFDTPDYSMDGDLLTPQPSLGAPVVLVPGVGSAGPVAAGAGTRIIITAGTATVLQIGAAR